MFYIVFSLALFISASLLFVIQPVVAKVLLPVYGGTPAVWTVCMLFFQALLLVSYAYAWVISRINGQHAWRYIHLIVCLSSLYFLPLGLFPTSQSGIPELNILRTLVAEMGLPLLVIAASAPLLQYAFSLTSNKNAADPYYLYVASNTGSLLALLSYPLLIERLSTITQQFYSWTIFYGLYAILLILLLFGLTFKKPPAKTSTDKSTSFRQKGEWILLSFIPCSLMLGVTFYITTDIAATPLLWVIPLALYLLSFIITFAKKPVLSRGWVERNSLVVIVFPIISFIYGAAKIPSSSLILFHLAGFFMLALLCHGELIKRRPPVSLLTTFYFCMAIGGVLAGLFNSIIAPFIFSYPYEYPLIILLSFVFIPVKKRSHQWVVPVIVLALLALNYGLPAYRWLTILKNNHFFEVLAVAISFIWPRSRWSLFICMCIIFFFIFNPGFKNQTLLTQQRNFYGIKQVTSHDGVHALISQSTLHGFQAINDKPLDGSVAYYGAVNPVMQQIQSKKSHIQVMVLGLGTGIMACQFREQDDVVMVEIDKQVIDIASTPAYFTYLKDCPPRISVIEADGRLAVSKAKNGSLDVIVIDVFNSDSIPTHLLTREAFNLYVKKIKPDGVILINISNRHLNLLPVVTAAGRHEEMIVLYNQDKGSLKRTQFPSDWALLTANEQLAKALMAKKNWRFVAEDNVLRWTDNYSNIIPVLRF